MGHLFVNSSHKPTGFDATVWAVKVVLITVGTVSSVILVKISVIPCLSSFLVSTLPGLWSFLRSFFSPPYIYILLNFIILIIAASSTFQQQSHHLKRPQKLKISYQITDYDRVESHDQKPKIWYQSTDYDRFESHDHEGVREIAVLDEVEVEKHAVEPLEKVVVGSRFDSSLLGKPGFISGEDLAEVKGMIAEPPEPRSPMKPEQPWEPEEPRKQEEPDDTLDSIWKSIMASQGKPLPGPDPEPEPCQGSDDPAVPAQREARKSDTFKEETAPLKLGKLLSQDELNLRAEAFIKKINLDMRLERQESDQRFMDMVYRGR